ncbi:MAG: NADH-quinone oxidoreductase subunit NuoH [bacterium]|nr:NADH-quinone oxidoreductase subunit NuoH [bacterium]
MLSLGSQFLVALGMLIGILIILLASMWLERKALAHFQFRLGPMRTGYHGLLQPIADAMKMVVKEMSVPEGVDVILYKTAPFIVFIPAFMVMAVIPFTATIKAADLNMGIFYVMAVLSISTIGYMMAGWSSHNKYSLLGCMRSIGQFVSYELPMGLSVLAVVMMAGTLNLNSIAQAQSCNWNIFRWYIFKQPLAFIIFFIALNAEICRVPFDLPEAESELVAGFHVEYSGMRFALLLMAEYVGLFTLTSICTTLFLGGWYGPPVLPGLVWFFLKTFSLIFILFWTRATLPRVRADQLMSLGWKVLMPAALINVVITGLLIMLKVY